MAGFATALVFRALVSSSVPCVHEQWQLTLTVKTLLHLLLLLRFSTKNAMVIAVESRTMTILPVKFSIRLGFVTMTGLEPAHREIHASETCVSTNSTTWPNDTLVYPATGIAVVPLCQQSVRRRG